MCASTATGHRQRVGVHVVQQGLEHVWVHVADAHIARGLLLGHAKEVSLQDHQPGSEQQLVCGEYLVTHLEHHVCDVLRLQEVGVLLDRLERVCLRWP